MSDYILKFSNKFKEETIRVPDMPPGINTVDTSLNLVGRGYPAYGEKIAENFLHLLENFSSPIPPENPIEGQLWYDTSNPQRKILRVMDGTASAARWPSVSGIYQQGTDPKLSPSAGLKNGDIWVDITNGQLKIFKNNNWITVGPIGSSGTGPQTEELVENTAAANRRTVTVHRVNGEIVLIISSGSEFVPNPSIPGFPVIKPGINLTTILDASSNPYLFFGTAENSNKLGNIHYTNYVLKTVDQTIDASFTFKTPDDRFGRGKYGILIKRANDLAPNDYVQFYKDENNAAVILNAEDSGSVRLEVGGGNIPPRVKVEKNLVTINTSTDINGLLTVTNIISKNNITVQSTLTVKKDVFIGKSLNITSSTTASGTLYIGSRLGTGLGIVPNNNSTYDIGSHLKPFRSIYAENVYALNSIYSLNYDQLPQSTGTVYIPRGGLGHYVEAYGAVGDGVTDDTDAIQDALDAARIGLKGSNTVILSARKYRVTRTLTVQIESDKIIRIHGEGSHNNQPGPNSARGTGSRIFYEGTGPALKIYSGYQPTGGTPPSYATYSTGEPYDERQFSFFELSDFLIYNNGSSEIGLQIGETNQWIHSNRRPMIKNLHVDNFNTCVYILNSAMPLNFLSCTFLAPDTSTGTAVRIESSQYFSGDIVFKDTQLKGSAFLNNTGSAVHLWARGANSAVAAVHFNHCFLYYGKYCMKIEATGASSSIQNIYVIGNQFDGLSEVDICKNAILATADSATSRIQDLHFSDNYMFGWGDAGETISGSFVPGNGACINLVGNSNLDASINTVTIKGNYLMGNKAINAEYCVGLTVQGNISREVNTLGGPDYGSLYCFKYCKYFSAIGNIFTSLFNPSGNPSYYIGINNFFHTFNSSYYTIIGNAGQYKGSGTGIFELGASNNTVANNQIFNIP